MAIVRPSHCERYSSCIDLAARSYSVGKSFGSPHLLQQVAIPRFDPHQPIHLRLAELSKKAHELTRRATQGHSARPELTHVEDEIDLAVAELWNILPAELADIRAALSLVSKGAVAKKKVPKAAGLFEVVQAGSAT